MMTPCTSVRFQNSRHQGMSYRTGSFSVTLVWPQRRVRRYHGSVVAAPAGGLPAATSAAAINSRLVVISSKDILQRELHHTIPALAGHEPKRTACGAGISAAPVGVV